MENELGPISLHFLVCVWNKLSPGITHLFGPFFPFESNLWANLVTREKCAHYFSYLGLRGSSLTTSHSHVFCLHLRSTVLNVVGDHRCSGLDVLGIHIGVTYVFFSVL